MRSVSHGDEFSKRRQLLYRARLIVLDKPADRREPKAMEIEAGELVRDSLADLTAGEQTLESACCCRTRLLTRFVDTMAASILLEMSLSC
jgi:hypothetical protein